MRLVLLFTIVAVVWPADSFAQRTLPQLKLGRCFWGEPVGVTRLQRGIVVLHYWSTSIPCSSAAMPALEKFYRKYKNNGLFVIAVHERKGPLDLPAIWKIAHKYKISYPIVLGGKSPRKLEYVPHLFVYDVGSHLVYDGDVLPGLQVARKLVAAYPQKIWAGKHFRFMRQQARQCAHRQHLGRLYKHLKSMLTKTSDPQRRGEIEALLIWLAENVKLEAAEFYPYQGHDPLAYLLKVRNFLQTWQGHPLATEIRQEATRLQKDASFKQLVKAARYYQRLESLFYSMEPCGQTGYQVKKPQFHQKNAATLRSFYRLHRLLTTKFSNTPYARKAQKMADQLR